MDENEDREFRAIAMGALSENEEFVMASRMAANGIATCFGMLKRYGIESTEGLIFVCRSGEPVVTVIMEPHMRDHLR